MCNAIINEVYEGKGGYKGVTVKVTEIHPTYICFTRWIKSKGKWSSQTKASVQVEYFDKCFIKAQ